MISLISDSSNFIEVKNVVDEIVVMVRRLGNVSFSLCSHAGNHVTHYVARYVVGFKSHFGYFLSSNSEDLGRA